MTQPDSDSNSKNWREEIASIRADVAELTAARAELAQLELAASIRTGKRCAIAAGGCTIVATAGTALLLALCGEQLATRFGGSTAVWQGSLAAASLALGLGGLAWLARRVRRNFRPFSGLAAELKEDALWIKEWLGS